MTDRTSLAAPPTAPLRTALTRIAVATAATVLFLFLAGELRPGGALTLYGSLLAVFTVQQIGAARRSTARVS